MSGKMLSGVRATIRQFLRDEFESTEDYDFPDDEIDLHIADCLVEISERSPYEVKETLKTTASSRELDITSIEDFIGLAPENEIEYPVGSDPPDYHNASIFGKTLKMNISALPSANQDVYLFCHKVHQLNEDSSTLDLLLEKVLVDGATAKVALGWINEGRTQVKEAISKITDVDTAIGNMTARVTQAITDLTTGRASIGVKVTEAITSIGNMSARITQAQSDLTSGRALIGSKLTEVNTAIGNMSARITQAQNDLTSGRALIGSKKTEATDALDAVTAQITQATADLTSGRAQIDDARALADAAIDDMSARITQAQSDLTSGRPLIGQINIGGKPQTDYANYAGRELAIAIDYLNQARGYLGEGITADRYQAYAGRVLQLAAANISQARGYLALDVVTSEYGNFAARELSNANSYLAQARGYLAMEIVTDEYGRFGTRELANANAYLAQARGYLATDVESGPYANYAARELSNATTYLNQAGGYIRQITSRLNIGKAMSGYQVWANNKLVLYQRELRGLARARTYVEYSKS